MAPPSTDGPPAEPDLLDYAIDLATRAGRSTLEWFRNPDLPVERKGDGTPVTVADRNAERLVREALAADHPDDAILGEEEGEVDGTSGRRWFIDPIDGTKAFTRGVPLYTTLLAVHDAHGPLVGVIHMPALGETVAAGRGLGCVCDGVPAHVSERPEARGAVLTTSGFDYWPGDTLLSVQRAGFQMRTWGDGYGYALVATGRVEAMVDPVAGAWDLAPMPVIIAEAGGRFTSGSGENRIDGGSGVATNGVLHDTVLTALAGG